MLPRAGLAALALLSTTLAATLPALAQASALFAAAEVDPQNFVLVAAPIGTSGEKAQLNIYEQLKPLRACFEVGAGRPAPVNPLLATFDFTGICNRYIDANGYSVRVGGQDLATTYRLMVTRSGGDLLLLAFPTKAGAGPEMVVARTGGNAAGFLKLELEPGWRLMRRQFGGRNLGHLYVYSESWPAAAVITPQAGPPVAPQVVPPAAQPAQPVPPAQPAVQATPAAAQPAPSAPSSRAGQAAPAVQALPAAPPVAPPAAAPLGAEPPATRRMPAPKPLAPTSPAS